MHDKPLLILIGGFLGAGKTTLLDRAAQILSRQGRRVGLITNDQSTHLVDTERLRTGGRAVEEVGGGCFCCQFDELLVAADRLRERGRDVILAEAVGSCTDLAATVVRPMKKNHEQTYRVAPLSVVLDPFRTQQVLAGAGFDADVRYIFHKQIEEADLILLNKTDAMTAPVFQSLQEEVRAKCGGRPVLRLSALRNDGIETWLKAVMRERSAEGTPIEVDYQRYAEGEAMLGWLNAAGRLHAKDDRDWSAFGCTMLEELHSFVRARGAEIAHVKLSLVSAAGCLTASLTGSDGTPQVQGATGKAGAADLIVNARVQGTPEVLRTAVLSAAEAAMPQQAQLTWHSVEAFRPAPPRPTHRSIATGT